MKKASARRSSSEPMRFHPLLSVTTFFLGIIAMFVIQRVFALGTNPNFIYACVHKGDGNIRIIDGSTNCKPEETPLSWNIQGPPGQPGPQGPAGNGYFGLPFMCGYCVLNQYAGKFQGRDFTGAEIWRSDFSGSDIHETIFQGGFFTNDDFSNTNASGTDFSNLKNLPNWGDSSGLNFSNANLTGATFANSFFEGNFSNANFMNANLSNATISSSNFSGAKNLSTANVTGSVWNATTCPDGTYSDNHNHTCVGHF